jgi:nucleoid-associated protein YejK
MEAYMTVNNLIIHKLAKETQGTASLTLSKDALESSDKKTISLTEELNSRYRNNITYGIFRENKDDAETFQKEFDKYLAKRTKGNFIKFSNKTVNMLYSKINSISQARGGYLVYVDYTERNNQFFSVFLIRDKTDKQFKPKDGIIKIDEVICVETDKLAMACRVNIKLYQERDTNDAGNYLGFVSIKQPDTSNYFIDWIGAEKKQRDTEDTRSLVRIIHDIDVPDEDGKPMSREDFHKKAYDIIRSFKKSPVNINTLSATLFGDESMLAKYAEENDIVLNSEFVQDPKVARKLVSFSIFIDNIKLEFPSKYYGDKISIDKTDPNLVLIRSERLAREIEHEGSEW